MLHIQELTELLGAAMVPAEAITIFSSDGADPEPDLAVRNTQRNRDAWLLQSTPLEKRLQSSVQYHNSVIAGTTLRPATPAASRL